MVLVLAAYAHGNELTMTFDVSNSVCTSQCSSCSSADIDDGDSGGIGSDMIDDLLNITSANSQDIREVLEQIARVSSMVSYLKNTAMTTSATLNDILASASGRAGPTT